MTSKLLKYNVVILIVLFIGMTLIHNSSQKFDDDRLEQGKLNLYYTPGSPPCRAVLLTAKALKVDFHLIPMNLFGNEHKEQKFLQINPQHSLPTLVLDDFALWESRAIMVYLVETRGIDDDPLYPKDPEKRALINQRLQFDLGTLYQAFIDQCYKSIFGYEKKTEAKEKILQEALGFLDTFLGSREWVVGDSMTLADISLVATISTFEVAYVDLSEHKRVTDWLNRCKTSMISIGYDEINQVGVDLFKEFVDKKLAKTVAQMDLVTKNEVLTAIEVLRKAVKANIIGEEFSDSIEKIHNAVPHY